MTHSVSETDCGACANNHIFERERERERETERERGGGGGKGREKDREGERDFGRRGGERKRLCVRA